MSRYIDADALKEWLDEYLSVFKKYDKSEVKGFVEHQPSIDIVRCKECLHSYEWDSGCGAELVCKVRRCDPADWGSRVEFYVKADDFCSYGERREP